MAFPAVASAQGLAFFMYNKPYLPIPDQITLLQSRGMVIEDYGKASEYLQRIGYYRLSAYWHPMRRRCSESGDVLDEFVDGTTFKDATDLYTFDGRLRLIMLDALERLEVSLRTEVALCLGKYHPHSHRLAACLGRDFDEFVHSEAQTKHQLWLARLDEKAAMSKDKFAEHFRQKYSNSHMPVWIAVELLDFGALSHLLSGMKNSDVARIGAGYGGIKPDTLKSWVRSLSFTRNICAHHSRLWNKPLVNQPALGSPSIPERLHHLQTLPDIGKRLYSVASISRHLLSVANPRTAWKVRFVNHIDTFPTSPRYSLSSAGFPENWKNQELWN